MAVHFASLSDSTFFALGFSAASLPPRSPILVAVMVIVSELAGPGTNTGSIMATFAAQARTVTDIATSVRDARLAAGMSQADLAAAAHLNRSWVSLFESGHTSNPSLSEVLAMMDVLGITIRLSYTVPDSVPLVLESARRPRRSPEEAEMVEAPAEDGEVHTAAVAAPLDEVALATARAIRESHRARAIADDLDRRSSND